MHTSSPNHTRTAQEEMLRIQIVERGITNPRLLAALRAVPRHHFFPPGTRDNVYADRPHPIGHGQTISQPYIVALMTDRLDLQPLHRVLEIGTGSGYQTAVLSHLVGEVYTIERVKPLLDEAFERLQSLHYKNIRFKLADGSMGWPFPSPSTGTSPDASPDASPPPFDRILIAAGLPNLPRPLLLSQLADGGTAILPIGPPDHQMLTLVRRQNTTLASTEICPCRFVKLIGAQAW